MSESRPSPADTPASHTALEALLDAVWKAERNWDFDDRLDLAVKERR